MNIIINTKEAGIILDGISALLNLEDSQFNTVIKELKPEGKKFERITFYYVNNNCQYPGNQIQIGLEKQYDENGKFIGRGYHGGMYVPISNLFSVMSKQIENGILNENEANRGMKLLNTRNLEALKSFYINNNNAYKGFIDKVFEIVGNEEVFNKFLNFDKYIDYFAYNGIGVDSKIYLKYLADIFRGMEDDHKLSGKYSFLNNFYLPNIDEYKNRYRELYKKVNIERFVNPEYEFREFTKSIHRHDEIIRKNDEPEWKVNSDLYKEIFGKMPDGISLEEKVMYIYCSLCKNLEYDVGYLYKDKLQKGEYTSKFIKAYMENIRIGSKITCWDFARLFSNLVNGLDDDVEAVILSDGIDREHFSIGFYTDKVSVMLEPVNMLHGDANDLMKVKTGMRIEGIEVISDRDNIIGKTIDNVYFHLLGKNHISLNEYIKELQKLDDKNDVQCMLNAFIEIAKQRNISGNEAVQFFNIFHNLGFFGNTLEKVFLGKMQQDSKEKGYKRHVLIRNAKDEKTKNDMYLWDTNSMKLSNVNMREMIDRMNSGEFIYESEKHKMDGIMDRDER